MAGYDSVWVGKAVCVELYGESAGQKLHDRGVGVLARFRCVCFHRVISANSAENFNLAQQRRTTAVYVKTGVCFVRLHAFAIEPVCRALILIDPFAS